MRLAALTIVALFALGGCNQATDAPAAPAAPSEAWPAFDAPEAAKAPATDAPPLPTACSLVTPEQAQALLQAEASLADDDPENCTYMAMPSVGVILMLLVQVQQADDLPQAQEAYRGIVAMMGNLPGLVNQAAGEKTRKSGQEIEDLGDEAWLSGASFGPSAEELAGREGVERIVNNSVLTVRKGRRVLTLNVTGSVKAAGLGQRMVAAARGMVDKL
jgi:hypothetical protein